MFFSVLHENNQFIPTIYIILNFIKSCWVINISPYNTITVMLIEVSSYNNNNNLDLYSAFSMLMNVDTDESNGYHYYVCIDIYVCLYVYSTKKTAKIIHNAPYCSASLKCRNIISSNKVRDNELHE